MEASLGGWDALLSPTVPCIAPAISALADDDAYFATNALLLRNPSVVNFLDGCALTLPCQPASRCGSASWCGARH